MFDRTQSRRFLCVLIAGAAFSLGSRGSVVAQQTPAQAAAPARPAFFPDTLLVTDTTGYVSLFDGTLKGWDGDPAFWRAENNTIIGESTPTNAVKQNTF